MTGAAVPRGGAAIRWGRGRPVRRRAQAGAEGPGRRRWRWRRRRRRRRRALAPVTAGTRVDPPLAPPAAVAGGGPGGLNSAAPPAGTGAAVRSPPLARTAIGLGSAGISRVAALSAGAPTPAGAAGAPAATGTGDGRRAETGTPTPVRAAAIAGAGAGRMTPAGEAAGAEVTVPGAAGTAVRPTCSSRCSRCAMRSAESSTWSRSDEVSRACAKYRRTRMARPMIAAKPASAPTELMKC